MSNPQGGNDAKLILVMPPMYGLLDGFATGLISLANYVARHHPQSEPDILDLSTTHCNKLEQRIREVTLAPHDKYIVGITSTTASYQAALQVARLFKRIIPSCCVVFGGHHVSGDAEMVLRSHQDTVDYVIVGEGERSLAALVGRYPDVTDVPGLAYLNRGFLVRNPAPPLLEEAELDDIDITFGAHGLFRKPGKFGHVTYVSARGCPLKCAFCSVANERIRARSVAQIIRDVRQLTSFGYWRIAIEDNFFAHTAARTHEVCAALSELHEEAHLDFTWDCQTRVEAVARANTVPLLERAGCEAVYIGVESVVPRHLVYLNKAMKPTRYLQQLTQGAVPKLINSDVNCFINLQLGLPGETQEDTQMTISTLRGLGSMALRRKKKLTIFPMLHVVYPGTQHFYQGIKERRFPLDAFESFTAWEDLHTPVRTWLGRHFAHGTGGLPEGILVPDKVRRGTYEVDSDAVFCIANTLHILRNLDGIEVFDYGAHLVEDEPSDANVKQEPLQ
jgi:radical SAM superfamily enzyme YgiQ (UPF0313 family)